MNNRVRHYGEALLRGAISGRLLQVALTYWRHRQIQAKVIQQIGLTVRGGPFKGMQYISIPPRHGMIAKLLGCYEQEVHPFIETAMRSEPQTILNIGSAEGHYAIGMAVRLPSAQIFTYDIDARARDLCAALSDANGVSKQLHIFGLCDAEELSARIESGGKTLLIMDCEGCEGDLLNLDIVPELRKAEIIVEIHDFGTTTYGETIRKNFSASHTLQIVSFAGRDNINFPELSFLSPTDRALALEERISPQDWYYLRPRA